MTSTVTLENVQAALVNAGVGQDTDSSAPWMIYLGYIQDSPAVGTGAVKIIADRAIGLYETSGKPPQTVWAIDFPGVQVVVRGAPNGYQEARAKLQEIFDNLHSNEDALTPAYVYMECINSGPIPLGFDALKRPRLAQNYEIMRQRPGS